MISDGLQINDWSREVIAEVRSGGVDVVHATVGVWEDLAGTMARIGAFRHLCRHNADVIRIVRSVDEIHAAVADDVLAVVLGFQNSSMLGDDPMPWVGCATAAVTFRAARSAPPASQPATRAQRNTRSWTSRGATSTEPTTTTASG